MKKYIVFLFIVFGSCSDTIDFVPTNSYNEIAVWENEQSVNLYINSFYRIFNDYFNYGARPIGSDGTMSDGLTDIAKYSSNSPGEGTANLIMTQDGYTSVAANHFGVWANAYAWNRRILEFLEDLSKYSSKFSEPVRLRMEAEVRFFRGYIFFLTFRSHGPFIIRKSLADPLEMSINSEGECWDFIEADFDFAATHLPGSWQINTDDGRVTKWAALSMKARAMLYAERWQKAADASKKVIDEGGFALEANFADIFVNDKNRKSKEHILLKKYNHTFGLFHGIDEMIAPSGDIQGKGCRLCPTQELVDAFFISDGTVFSTASPFDSTMYLNRESRFYATILYNGATWKGRKVQTWVGENAGIGNGIDRFLPYNSSPYPNTTVTGYYFRKLADEANLNFDLAYRKSDQDCIEIRLAEVYLILAEAYINLNRKSDAEQWILKVRNRSLQEDVTTLKSDIKAELIKERMLELALEGHRFWDLRRWKLASNVLHGKKLHGAMITKLSNGKLKYERVDIDVNTRIYPERFDRFPYPISELNNNSKITTQPNGW
ncbi:MAG: RagB/SusD family nutrient uptake outer membrane protein [Saprospiraceae bacterium]|nr:RagB/SusD family nutrient uptake outer membrane protein [Saprospiraceae bacterium]